MTSDRGTFTERVRQELALVPNPDDAATEAELAVLLRCAATLALTSDGPAHEIETSSGAVARRVHQLVQALGERRPGLAVRTSGGLRGRQTYRVTVPTETLGERLGLLDDGSPVRRIPDRHLGVPTPGDAALRGALLACGSLSRPGRAAHAEFAVADRAVAESLAQLVEDAVFAHAGISDSRSGVRVVLKSRVGVGALLLAAGATTAFLEWDEQGLRHELRNEANRLANADAANVNRAVAAASSQVAAVEHAVEVLGWDALPADLRTVALARLANPAASLAEIGQLCDPPIGKSAVHRRIKRLTELASDDD